MRKVRIALVPGDGAGPEMMEVACLVTQEAAKLDGVNILWEETPMGYCAFKDFGDTFPQESFERATELGLLFFGGVGHPDLDKTIGKEHPEMRPEARALLQIRKKWGLLLNFRPMLYYPFLSHLANVNPKNLPDFILKQIFIRFLLQGSYFGTADLGHLVDAETRAAIGLKRKDEVTGKESQVSELAYYKTATLELYFREAFKCARVMGLPLISIDKANVMARSVLWRNVVTRIHEEEFPEIGMTHYFVDAANALLFSNPAALHGVVACGNLMGDVLSDAAAEAMGSLGMMCSSAINPETGAAMFESGAGTAPYLTGLDKANPIGRILSGAMMLRHIGALTGALAIENAVSAVLQVGFRTADILSADDNPRMLLGTKAMGEEVLSRL